MWEQEQAGQHWLVKTGLTQQYFAGAPSCIVGFASPKMIVIGWKKYKQARAIMMMQHDGIHSNLSYLH